MSMNSPSVRPCQHLLHLVLCLLFMIRQQMLSSSLRQIPRRLSHPLPALGRPLRHLPLTQCLPRQCRVRLTRAPRTASMPRLCPRCPERLRLCLHPSCSTIRCSHEHVLAYTNQIRAMHSLPLHPLPLPQPRFHPFPLPCKPHFAMPTRKLPWNASSALLSPITPGDLSID
jgi:hypothetical protein